MQTNVQFEQNTYFHIAEITNSTLSNASYLPSRYIIFRPFLEQSGVF